MKVRFATFLLGAITSPVFACVASENIDLYLASKSNHLPVSEILRLGNWVADQKVTYEHHRTEEATELSGHAESIEHNAHALAQSRMAIGKQLLVQMGFTRAPISTNARVYNKGDVDNGRRVEISFEPQCPNKCCSATTHDSTIK